MPLYRFPSRTRESDFGAAIVAQALDRLVERGTLSGRLHFMVSVVALRSKLTVVAFSGSNRDACLDALRAELSSAAKDKDRLTGELPLTWKQEKSLDKKRKQTAKEMEDLAKQKLVRKGIAQFERFETGATEAPVINAAPNKNFDLSKQLVDADSQQSLRRVWELLDAKVLTSRDLDRDAKEREILAALQGPNADALRAEVGDAFQFGPGRYCAEPKALELAYKSTETPMGMTTIWHGPVDDADFLPYVDPDGPAEGLQLALPCMFCQKNELRIMAHLESRYNPQSMRPGALARRHSISEGMGTRR